jgi:hypothetical protein
MHVVSYPEADEELTAPLSNGWWLDASLISFCDGQLGKMAFEFLTTDEHGFFKPVRPASL